MRGMAELPEAAREKLSAIEADRMLAEDAMRGCQQRINLLSRDTDTGKELLVRLSAERDRHAARFNSLSRLHSAINQWWMGQRAPLEAAPAISIELKPSEKLVDVVEATRIEIKSVRERIANVKAAPLPKADQKALVEEYVLRLYRQAQPRVAIVGDAVRVTWRGDTVACEDSAALLSWMSPDLLVAALMRELSHQPVHAEAVSVKERTRQVSELSVTLLALERREVALIERAAADGIEVLQRPDVSPLAFLGIAIATQEAQVA
jgi:hypothetical protein